MILLAGLIALLLLALDWIIARGIVGLPVFILLKLTVGDSGNLYDGKEYPTLLDTWEFWVCVLIGVVVAVATRLCAKNDDFVGVLVIVGFYIAFAASARIVFPHEYRVSQEWREARRAASVAHTERKTIESRAKAVREKERQQMEKLKAFALAESPGIWQSYQEISGEIEDREKKLGEFGRLLADFGRNSGQDARFRELRSGIDEMNGIRSRIVSKLEEAYLAKAKFDATIGAQEVGELREKVWNDGIREAEEAARRFQEMRDKK